MTDAEIEDRLREMFEENYELLLADGGHTLSPEVKNAALNQVLLYWRKLKGIATAVTDTEVLLVLPDQKSPQGRQYTIEGVVDIVQEADKTVMYDLKTHDAEYVKTHCELYEDQLNVYAYIWQTLRAQGLDEAAIIATSYPLPVKRALQPPVDQQKLDKALENWQPVVPITFNKKKVTATIEKLGKTIDDIENHQFGPRTVAELQAKSGRSRTFAQDVCGNCDGRFSCSAYQEYARASGHRQKSQLDAFLQQADEQDRDERLDAALQPQDDRPKSVGGGKQQLLRSQHMLPSFLTPDNVKLTNRIPTQLKSWLKAKQDLLAPGANLPPWPKVIVSDDDPPLFRINRSYKRMYEEDYLGGTWNRDAEYDRGREHSRERIVIEGGQADTELLLGCYDWKKKQIVLWRKGIELCAVGLMHPNGKGVPIEDLTLCVLVHELGHWFNAEAITPGNIVWDKAPLTLTATTRQEKIGPLDPYDLGQSLPATLTGDARSLSSRAYHEAWAQFFAWLYGQEHDKGVLEAFEALERGQSTPYQAWRHLVDPDPAPGPALYTVPDLRWPPDRILASLEWSRGLHEPTTGAAQPATFNDVHFLDTNMLAWLKRQPGVQAMDQIMCEFCKVRVATEQVARWDTWKMKKWSIPACSRCAPNHQQTWLT
jgi:hypothetical protein